MMNPDQLRFKTQHRWVAEEATLLADILPTSTMETASEALLSSDPTGLRAEIARRIPHHHHRDRVLAFVEFWQTNASTVDAITVAVALQTAASSEERYRAARRAEIVWTGPECGNAPFRRTEQAILQLLDSAQQRILLVSFAVYAIPNVSQSLVNAAKRGVTLTVVVETPDGLGGANEYSTLRALGSEVVSCSSMFYWPKENRKRSGGNKPGLLHAKCAVADGKQLFLSSANLTQQAFTINLELGLLLHDPAVAQQVEGAFAELIGRGVLQPVRT